MISSRQTKLRQNLALITAIICLLSYCGAAPSGPRIEIWPKAPDVVIEAQVVANKVLTCKAVGDKPEMFNTLRWAGPNDRENWQELSKRHKVKEVRNGLELEFLRPSPNDNGEYYCSGIYQSSDNYNASIFVRVMNPIKFEGCHDRQRVIKGMEGQKILCRVTGDSATSSIYKDEKPLESFGGRYKHDNDEGLEILGPVDDQDAGIYEVEALVESTGEKRKRIIQVDVHTRPEIPEFNHPTNNFNHLGFYGIEGEQAELRCNASGYPKPLVYWKDPKLRNLTSVGGYFVNPESGTLLITKVNRNDDNGTFQCTAENDVGKAERVISMVVLERPAITAFENKTFDEKSEATFECRATGYPKPTITIRKQGLNRLAYAPGDGDVTDVDETEEGGGARVYVYRVKIRASRQHYGLHYCNATNAAGTAERVGHLFVRHEPDLSLTPTEQFTQLGKNLSVTCHIRAYPAPQVSWYIENQQLINPQGHTMTSPDGQTHTITMMPPRVYQGNNARIICAASNSMGHSNVTIFSRYTTRPGLVNAYIVDRFPTAVKLSLTTISDGGDRIKSYKYDLYGTTNDRFSPLPVHYPIDHQVTTLIDASQTTSEYIIRNLYPNYRYKLTIRAINNVGEGDSTEFNFDTIAPSRPDPPVIVRPGVGTISQASSGIPSDYNNGYLLKWSPPDFDNGDPVTKYIIRFYKVDPEQTAIALDSVEERVIEQMNDRPMHAKIWPLEVNQRYKIELQARNKYGDSNPASIVVFAPSDKPAIANSEPLILSWLTEPPQTLLIALPILAILAMIIIDMFFCYYYQMGVSHAIKSCCCPAKANSVISDGTFT